MRTREYKSIYAQYFLSNKHENYVEPHHYCMSTENNTIHSKTNYSFSKTSASPPYGTSGPHAVQSLARTRGW
jgi:hypothetical protein